MRLGAIADVFAHDLAQWYQANTVPAAFQQAHPEVVLAVARLCGNDWQRCVIDADRSITVYNHKKW